MSFFYGYEKIAKFIGRKTYLNSSIYLYNRWSL